MRSAAKPARPTPAPRRRGDAATPERVEPNADDDDDDDGRDDDDDGRASTPPRIRGDEGSSGTTDD